MNSIECLVILSAWTYLSVSVDGVSVPSARDGVQGREDGKNFNRRINPNHRFSIGNNHQQRQSSNHLERRAHVENAQENGELGTLYGSLQSSALRDYFFGIPNRNGLYVIPQNNQENVAHASEANQPNNELPPLKNPRYPEQSQLQNNIHIQDHLQNQYYKTQKLPMGSIQNGAHEKYQTSPSDVLRIRPTSSRNLNLVNYAQIEQAKLKRPILYQLKPTVHKEYAQAPSLSYRPQPFLSEQSLKGHVPQTHTFIVSASEDDSNPVEHSNNKEPTFFVTEGYRNVLVQGANKAKKYRDVQHEEGSTENRTNRDANEKIHKEVGKPTRKRKVTKIYKNNRNDEDSENNGSGSSRNLVDAVREKPERYFEGPPVKTDNQRTADSKEQLTENYRDDSTHEPSDDHDDEREDDESEKIKDDDRDDAEDTEEENETDNEEEDDENEEDEKTKTNEAEETKSDEEEASDDEETESEEEEEEEQQQQQVPHSEHADPNPVPTQPIYPGAGLWAQRGLIHRPHVTQHRFLKPPEEERKPDGFDVFEDLEKYFETQKDQLGQTFGEKIGAPTSNSPVINANLPINQLNSANPTIVYDPFNEPSQRNLQQLPSPAHMNNQHGWGNRQIENTGPYQNIRPGGTGHEGVEGNKKPDDKDFVPVQLYTQVRKSDVEEHEPHNPAEHGRLKQVIKDSKIQTVYSEEGYEDGAYDHAGHQKEAEEDQGHVEFEQEKLVPRQEEEDDSDAGQSNKVLILDDPVEPLEDSLPSDSIYPSLPKENIIEIRNSSKIPKKKPKTTKNNNFITTQEVKTTQVKDKKNGDMQLEIESEVKVIVQPNNSTKAHKYVKIYPKVFREISKEILKVDQPEKGNSTEDIDTNISALNTTDSLDIKANKIVITTEKNKERDHNRKENDPNSFKKVTEVTSAETPTKVLVKKFRDEFDQEVKVKSGKPKVIVRVLDNDDEALKKVSEQFVKNGGETNRKKRSSPLSGKDLEVDIGFIDKINHTYTKKKPDVLDVQKYPYYAMRGINEDSPLRYAENLRNMPVKIGGELSFYNIADKQACPDLPQSIDPIPEHAQNAHEEAEDEEHDDEDEDEVKKEDEDEEDDDEESEDDNAEENEYPNAPDTPRVQLGDKIDCLKIRYFGSNPLDSPFFKEETVGPVKSIFKELEDKASKLQNSKNIDSVPKTSQIVENVNTVNEIFDEKDERKFETEVKDKVYNALTENAHKSDNEEKNQTDNNSEINTLFSIEKENENAESIRTDIRIIKPSDSKKSSQNRHANPTVSSLVTLITTPKYTIQLTPENIYDQIKLLDHLPEDDFTENFETTTKRIERTKDEKEAEIQKDVTKEAVMNAEQKETKGKEESSKRQPKIFTHGPNNIQERQEVNSQDSPSVEAQALRRRRLRPRKPVYQIFDVNKFLTTTPFSVISNVHSTVLPKYKVVSEVFYKDEIKPNEQLNVFADVLNNIKNSTNVELPLQSASNFAEPNAVTISSLAETNIVPQVQEASNIRVKKYQKDSSNEQKSINLHPVHPSPTEKTYNARFPVSYEEDQHRTRYPTNKNTGNINFNDPDATGYMHENAGYKPEHIVPDHDIFENEPNSSPNTIISTSTRKSQKRRRKPTKGTTSTTLRTTTNINVPVQSTPSNHQPYVIDFLEEPEEVVGLVPPTNWQYKTIVEDSDARGTYEEPEEVYEYKTILPNVEEPITHKIPAPVSELSDEQPPARAMNKYYFLGLKPPLNERARPYREFIGNNNFVNNNFVRRGVNNVGHGHVRVKRGAGRATYSDVSRNRGKQGEGVEKETPSSDDTDDYVPHRPKNYHYDEKTGKIIYHKKPEEEKEKIEDDEEYEEIEVSEAPGRYLERAEDATHPSPKKVTTKPLLATATPPPEGQGLLDFVAKLKNNPTYKYIPDPTTPDPAVSSTTQDTVTVDPKSTNAPEFLNILSKVKSDSSYKFIEDPKETQSKTKSRSTTPEPEDEEAQEEEDEAEEENIQNSPGEQTPELSNIQIFDISDFLPKIETISPKTSIDYSKYKTIERPHTRHNMSSKYNSEEQPNLDEVVNVSKPSIEETESINTPVVSEEKLVHDKEVETVTQDDVSSISQKIVQNRRGTKASTQRTTAEYVEPTESAVTKRTANRRRPLPSGFTTRKPGTTEITEATEQVERVTPQYLESEKTYSQNHDQAKRVYRKRPIRIRHTTERQEEDDDSVDKIMRRSLDYEGDDVQDKFEQEFLGS